MLSVLPLIDQAVCRTAPEFRALSIVVEAAPLTRPELLGPPWIMLARLCRRVVKLGRRSPCRLGRSIQKVRGQAATHACSAERYVKGCSVTEPCQASIPSSISITHQYRVRHSGGGGKSGSYAALRVLSSPMAASRLTR